MYITILVNQVYWYISQVSGERLQGHWSSGYVCSNPIMIFFSVDGHHLAFLYDRLLCAPLVADLFLYCYKRDFTDSLNHDNQADVIEAFNSISRYLDDLLNIDNPYSEVTIFLK